MFATLLGVSMCITLHLGQCSMVRFKFVSNADFSIAMQVCTLAHEFICFNPAAISYNSGPCLQDTYLVYTFYAAPASADSQFSCAAFLHFTSAI